MTVAADLGDEVLAALTWDWPGEVFVFENPRDGGFDEVRYHWSATDHAHGVSLIAPDGAVWRLLSARRREDGRWVVRAEKLA